MSLFVLKRIFRFTPICLFSLSLFTWISFHPLEAYADNSLEDHLLQELSGVAKGDSDYASWSHASLYDLGSVQSLDGRQNLEVYGVLALQKGYVVVQKNPTHFHILEFGKELPASFVKSQKEGDTLYYLGAGGFFATHASDPNILIHLLSNDTLDRRTVETVLNQKLKDLAGGVLPSNWSGKFTKLSTPTLEPEEGLGVAIQSLNNPSTFQDVLHDGGWVSENFATSNYFVIHAVQGFLTLSNSESAMKSETSFPEVQFLKLKNVFLPKATAFYASTDFSYVFVTASAESK